MPVDFLEVRHQINEIGKSAPALARRLKDLQEQARRLLEDNAQELDSLKQKIVEAVNEDPYLRCARPVSEVLDAKVPEPPLPVNATILAADGSQINPDRHAPVNYYLINVGAIEMRPGSGSPPRPEVRTSLYYGPELYTSSGTVTDAIVALKRDQYEREMLANLAKQASSPVITLTDGPVELWGGKGQSAEETAAFTESLQSYLKALTMLYELGTATAGYVDKPRADLVVRLLEVASTPPDQLKSLRKHRRLRGVTDDDLYRSILGPGERSAVFAIQSKSAENYTNELALHFFYLNVGQKKPWIARVEIPAWVVRDKLMLNNLHAVLVNQCRIMGTRTYPYVLHRAHEVALVTRNEKDQVSEMLMQELRKQGLDTGEGSQKQAAKSLTGRRRFQH